MESYSKYSDEQNIIAANDVTLQFADSIALNVTVVIMVFKSAYNARLVEILKQKGVKQSKIDELLKQLYEEYFPKSLAEAIAKSDLTFVSNFIISQKKWFIYLYDIN